MKKVCFFGIYDSDYPRNKVLLQGLALNGYEISHCHVDPRIHKGFKKYWLLAREQRKLRGEKFDFVLVAFPGHTCVWLAKVLFPNNLIVFDVFLSLFEANVSDRRVHSAKSWKGLRDRFLDWYGIRVADVVTLDTHEHIRMFGEMYGLKKSKAIRIFIGSSLSPSIAKERSGQGKFIVHFHGSFIPQHGIEYVIRAAKLLEGEKEIVFRLVGGGQQLGAMKALAESLRAKNVTFLGRLAEYDEVLKNLSEADVALGIFGTAERAKWVIVNKIFEGLAFGKAIISSDNAAMRELFTDRENILFCRAGEAEDLSDKILELYKNEDLRHKIGAGAARVFKEELAPKNLVANFLNELKKYEN